jgi:hypothetical protein
VTAGQVRAALGNEADTVLQLADTYAKLRTATDDAAKAKANLASIKVQQDYEQQVAADIARIDQQAIDDAEKLQKVHDASFDKVIAQQKLIAQGWQLLGQAFHDSYQKAIDALDAQIKAAQRENQGLAQQAADHIQGEQDDLADYQQGIQARRDAANADLETQRAAIAGLQKGVEQAQAAAAEAQEAVTRAQAAQTEHQAAFQAVLNGTIDLFNQEHTQQDEITQAIIRKWDAEISGARRAKEEADQRVRADTEDEHRLQLAYDKRIQAARDAHREDQARALERERDRVLAAQRQKGQVNRDEAAVAGDELGDRTANAQQAAQQQQSADQVAINAQQARQKAAEQEVKAAEARVKAAQQELATQEQIEKDKEAAENEEVKRRQAQITHDQRTEAARARAAQASITTLQQQRDDLAQQQKDSDAFYKSIVDNINNVVIPAVEHNKDVQHTKDQQQIDDAKTIKDGDDAYWLARKRATDQAIIDATTLYNAANDTVARYSDQITRLDTINQRLDDRILKEQAYLNLLRQEAGLPALPVGIKGASDSPVSGNVDDPTSGGTRTTPQGGDSTPGSVTKAPPAPPAAATPAATPSNAPTVPGTSNAPVPPPLVAVPSDFSPVDSTTTAAIGATAPSEWPDDPSRPPPLPYGYDASKFVWFDDKAAGRWTLLYRDKGQYRAVPAVPPIPLAAPPTAATPAGGGSTGGGLNRTPLYLLATSGSGKATLLPPVAPDYPAVAFDDRAHARAFAGGLSSTHSDTGGAGMRLSVAGNLVHIEHVNASDPQDVENMIGTIERRIWGGADLALEMSRRGGTWQGRRGGNG